MPDSEPYVPWSLTAQTPRFFGLDARAVFPLGLWLLHWSTLTLSILLISLGTLIILGRMGMPLDAFPFYLRARLVGPLRPAADVMVFRRRSRF
jgi:intracellular multiplication protein IcmT